MTASAEQNHAALAALRAGAIGHISKEIEPSELANLVTLAADGEAIIPRWLTMPLLERLREVPNTGWRPVKSRLTTREWEIVELLGDGASTNQIDHRGHTKPVGGAV